MNFRFLLCSLSTIISVGTYLSGCSNNKVGTDISGNQYSFTEESYSFNSNDKVDFKEKLTPKFNNEYIYKWDSSNKEVASISSDGVLTCLKPGFTTISLTKDVDSSIYCQVSVNGLEIDQSKLINPTNYLNEIYKYRLVQNGETTPWSEAVGKKIIDHITFEDNKAVVDYKYTISGQEYTCRNYTNLIESYSVTSVHNIKNITESGKIFHLHGIVVKSYYEGSSSSGYINPEILLKSADERYDDYIGINCTSFNLMSSTNYLLGLESGDEVIMNVKIVQSNMYGEWNLLNSDFGRKNIVLQSLNFILVNKGRDYSINKNNAIEISTRNEFAYYMNRTNDRLPALYKLFKFVAGSRYALDSSSKAIMIGLDNESNSQYSYYFDEIIAAFYVNNQKYTLSNNKTYEQLLLSEGVTFTPGDYVSEQYKSSKNVYAMYVGGRGTYMPYHNFVIFGDEYVE